MTGTLSPRAAYLLTKVAVFVVAAALTWPLARVIGPRAWWGLGAFGLILAVLRFFFLRSASSSTDKIVETVGAEVRKGDLDAALARLGQYDWLVFSSINGVRYLLGRLFHAHGDSRRLGSTRLPAIGPATAEELLAATGPAAARTVPRIHAPVCSPIGGTSRWFRAISAVIRGA